MMYAEEIQGLAKSDDDPAYEVVAQALAKFSQMLKDIERCRQIASMQLKGIAEGRLEWTHLLGRFKETFQTFSSNPSRPLPRKKSVLPE